MQEQEVGDGTNLVIVFVGALLEAAEELLRMVWNLVHNIRKTLQISLCN